MQPESLLSKDPLYIPIQPILASAALSLCGVIFSGAIGFICAVFTQSDIVEWITTASAIAAAIPLFFWTTAAWLCGVDMNEDGIAIRNFGITRTSADWSEVQVRARLTWATNVTYWIYINGRCVRKLWVMPARDNSIRDAAKALLESAQSAELDFPTIEQYVKRSHIVNLATTLLTAIFAVYFSLAGSIYYGRLTSLTTVGFLPIMMLISGAMRAFRYNDYYMDRYRAVEAALADRPVNPSAIADYPRPLP